VCMNVSVARVPAQTSTNRTRLLAQMQPALLWPCVSQRAAPVPLRFAKWPSEYPDRETGHVERMTRLSFGGRCYQCTLVKYGAGEGEGELDLSEVSGPVVMN
jgi:hypothetical protein